jgi:peptidoglycan/LPS O-acetylase OafA/YrhL
MACIFTVLSFAKADQLVLKEIPFVFLNSIFFLPYFSNLNWPYGNGLESSGIFPLNLPGWSLFFEVFISIFCFIYIKLFKKLPGFFIGTLAYFTFIISIFIYHDPNAGWSSGNFILGFPRVFGCFFIGTYIYQFNKINFLLSPNYKFKLFFLLLIVLFFISTNEIMAFINSLVIMPLAVLIFSYESTNLKNKLVYISLGFISYPLYVLHIPLFTYMFRHLGFIFNYGPIISLLMAGFITLFCATVLGYFDLKFRKLFT